MENPAARSPWIALAPAVLVALAGCTSLQQRAKIGNATIEAVDPATVTQTITTLPIGLEEGRVIAGGAFDAAATPEGCLRGHINLHDLTICTDRLDPREPRPAARRWVSVGNEAMLYPANFTVELQERGRSLKILVGRFVAILRLGEDRIADAFRASPELAGVLFAYGLPPASRDGIYQLNPDPGTDAELPDPSVVRRELDQAYREYAAACLRHDLPAVMARLTDDVTWTYPNGESERRAQIEKTMGGFLESLGQGSQMTFHLVKLTLVDPRIAVADVALDTLLVMRDPQDPARSSTRRYTTWWHDTWKKGPKGWQNQSGLEQAEDPFARTAARGAEAGPTARRP